MNSQPIHREEVESALLQWAQGALSDEQFRLWVVNRYFPAHQAVAPNEPNHVALAIGSVLTEFECAATPFPFNRGVASSALALLRAGAAEFEARLAEFYKSLEANKNAL